MALLFSGQKRKSKAALEEVRSATLSAGQLLSLGDYEAARERYDEILRTLKSDAWRPWVAGGLIGEAVWNDLMATALLGRIRAISGVDGRVVAFKKAELMMTDVLALKPDWPEAYDYLAGLAIARGEARSARPYVESLLAINPRRPRTRLMMAIINFEDGDYEEAARALTQLPETAESLAYLGRCQLRLQNLEAAIKTFERARARFATTFDLSYYHGCALAHAGRYSEARQEFEAAAALDPQRPEPSTQLGHLCLLAGQADEAEKHYKAAIAFGTRAAAAHYGLALLAAGNSRQSYEAHLDGVRQADEHSELLAAARADACERAGDNEQARRFYLTIPARSPLYGAVITRLGFMSFRAGNYVAALDLLRQAALLRPEDDRLLDLLGAAAAVTGEFRLAESPWAQLEARGTIDKKTAQALDHARLWSILEAAYQGQAASAIEPLEALHRKSSDDAIVSAALADVYFIAAIEALEAAPPETERAQEFLLLGKHLTAHLKFEYGLALADLLAGRFAAAAARLRSMLVTHPRNSGAAYHLGVALARAGDRRAAEPAFRQALAYSQKDAARQQRLKWALAALLFSDRRWADSLTLLRELAPSDEFMLNETPPQVYELMMRCYALTGDWEASERLSIGAGGRQTTLAAIILARRNMKAVRWDAALSHLERYLAAGAGGEAADESLLERAKRVVTQLALKTAAQRVKEERYDEARDLLLRMLASVADRDGSAEARARLNEFVQALQERATYPQRVERLAAGYEAIPVESVLEKDDLETLSIEIPVILPPKSQRALDQIERPVFDATQWQADTYPELLLAFDA